MGAHTTPVAAGLDVLLVTPPSRLQVYQDLSNEFAAIEPPVWSGLIAHFLRQRGHCVGMLDAEALNLTHEETARRVAEADPRLVIYVILGQQPSASTQCMPGGRKTALAAATLTDRPSLVIGTHPSALPERTLLEEPYTYVCRGEGPLTALGLMDALSGRIGLDEVPGLVWRDDDGGVHVNAAAGNLSNLDADLPSQAWDLLDMSRYRAHNWQTLGRSTATKQPYVSVQTSLGCPYRCNFCCINAPFGGSGIRYWSPDTIMAQIDHLVERYGIKMVKIPDEMFVLNKNHVLGLCDRLIDRGYDLNIWAYARIDTVQPVFLEKLRRAGFQWLGIGIESASNFVRDGVTKGKFRTEDVIDVVRRIEGHGINVSSNFIFGLPDDDHDSMTQTLDMAMTLNTAWANFYAAMAYPGSRLYDDARANGWQLPDDPGGPGWIGYSQHAYDAMPLPTRNLSALEVLKFRDLAFHQYFESAQYIDGTRTRFGDEAVAHIQRMTAHRLRRRHHDDPEWINRL